ncbi:MAG TPA: enoyl-CoA hydratase-related protein [Actinomycetota bacterium]|nr:enoyl-CoA hydratase-related protein [Actinomycetota bacterium]
MGEYESLRWEQAGFVATVTLDRPEKKNAMSRVMFDEIGAVFDRASAEDAVRCLVLTGAGDAFCSGADLSDPANLVSGSLEGRERMRMVHQVVTSVVTCTVPTIAKVTGVAAGAGCNLAFGCDLIVATRNATFAELFVKRGLVVDFGGSWALTRLLPLNKAKELALLGDTISAGEADRLGLLNRLCEPEDVDAVVKDLSERLAALPPKTVSLIKENMTRATERSLEETLHAESMSQSLLFGSDDTREAISAWVEKREPRFTGR